MIEALHFPLVVEGLTDAAFFQEIFLRLYLHDGSKTKETRVGRENIAAGVVGISADGRPVVIDFLNRGGKRETSEVIRGLFLANITEFTVSQDVDRGSNEKTIETINAQVGSAVQFTSRESETEETRTISPDVRVIPMGLPQNQTLAELGVAKHELEDYLVLLILRDPGLRESLPDLEPLLKEMLPKIRENDGPFDSSKEIFQLIKPLVQHGFSDVGVIQKIIPSVDLQVLKTVLGPLLGRMDTAFGLGPLAE